MIETDGNIEKQTDIHRSRETARNRVRKGKGRHDGLRKTYNLNEKKKPIRQEIKEHTF